MRVLHYRIVCILFHTHPLLMIFDFDILIISVSVPPYSFQFHVGQRRLQRSTVHWNFRRVWTEAGPDHQLHYSQPESLKAALLAGRFVWIHRLSLLYIMAQFQSRTVSYENLPKEMRKLHFYPQNNLHGYKWATFHQFSFSEECYGEPLPLSPWFSTSNWWSRS